MKKIPDPLEMPQRLKTLDAYVHGAVCGNHNGVHDMLADGEWPCPTCDGIGMIYNYNASRYPIEGTELRRWIKCHQCGGSGCGERDWWEKQWQLARARRAAEINAFESMRSALRRALAKLTTEEAAALGWEKPEPTILEPVSAIRKGSGKGWFRDSAQLATWRWRWKGDDNA